MTHQQKLEAIRWACVKANPKQLKEGDDPRSVLIRNIGLADVLLTIRGKIERKETVIISGEMVVRQPRSGDPLRNMLEWFFYRWDLRNDDLSKQSEETVDFIHGLLEGV